MYQSKHDSVSGKYEFKNKRRIINCQYQGINQAWYLNAVVSYTAIRCPFISLYIVIVFLYKTTYTLGSVSLTQNIYTKV